MKGKRRELLDIQSKLISRFNELQMKYLPAMYAHRDDSTGLSISFSSTIDLFTGFDLARMTEDTFEMYEASEDYINEFTFDELDLLSRMAANIKRLKACK